MSKLIKKKSSSVSNLTRLQTLSKQFSRENSTKLEIKQRILRLKEIFADYQAVQDDIDATCGDDELKFQFIEREQNEEIYFDALMQFETLLNEFETIPKIETPDKGSSNIKLPTINLPIFSGKYEEWPSFSNLFKSIIHKSEQLSCAQKLHYLKANLSGEAADLIKNFQLTDQNYLEAFKIISDRYNNIRFIIDSHLKLFFGQPSLLVETAQGLRQLRDRSVESIRALKGLGQPTDTWDTLLVYNIVGKLDNESRRLWETTLQRNTMPTFCQLMEFLDQRWQCLEMVPHTSSKKTTSNISNIKTQQTPKVYNHYVQHQEQTSSSMHIKPKCLYCHNDHYTNLCSTFRQLSYETKTKFVRENNLCFNCLKRGHSALQCKSSTCHKCNRRHHTLLHNSTIQSTLTSNPFKSTNNHQHNNTTISPSTSSVTPAPSAVRVQQSPATITDSTSTHWSHMAHHQQSTSQVLLSTALVSISGPSGNVILRALIDSGSQISLISKHFVTRLALKETNSTTLIKGLGDSLSSNSSSTVQFNLSSLVYPDFSIVMQAFTIDKITTKLPTSSFSTSKFNHLTNISLADPNYFMPGQIDLLIGADMFGTLLLNGIIKGPLGTPIAQHTQLGWILSGKVGTEEQPSSIASCNMATIGTIDTTLKQFWEIEEIPNNKPLTKDEEECEAYFYNTHTRTSDGRFMVHLPFNCISTPLENSSEAAISRLKQMEKRFTLNPPLKRMYEDFINEYLSLNHMELIPESEVNVPTSECFYLPHHAVIKDSSTTTKLRVVFDGSATTKSGVSINDKLFTGPTLQNDIMAIILRWRKHKIVFVADIAKMYRQILITKKHTNYQRIVWRSSTSDPIQHYRLLTVTYGMSCSPYLAIRCLRQLAEENKTSFPTASNAILNDFYVDDLISGADNHIDAIVLQQQINKILQTGQLELRKWRSNDEHLLKSIPENHIDTSDFMSLPLDQSMKTLGILWHSKIDCFGFTWEYPPTPLRATKRSIISDVAKLFDPLGLLAPVVIVAKMFLQDLWLTGLGWDDYLPLHLENSWKTYRSELMLLNKIKIPRWLGVSTNDCVFELHGFADASTKAYAAVVYARVSTENGVIVSLLTSKTKVAPVKTISVPRLELCAALLLAKLLEKVKNALQISSIKCTAWSDSTIVLAWIKKLPVYWKTFVANRVTQIQSITTPQDWNHVQSQDNPADCASRGLQPHQLQHHALWWTGPPWLSLSSTAWPAQTTISETNVELREVSSFITVYNPTNIMSLIEKYSSLEKLIRVISYCRRFIALARKIKKDDFKPSYISASERYSTLQLLIGLVQHHEFKEELSQLNAGNNLSSKSRLKGLNPFLDNFGIMRLDGRIQNAELPPAKLRPIILPKHNHLTNLIISHTHRFTLHGGLQLMMCHLSKIYFIIGAKQLIRTCIHRCIVCIRHRATTHTQLMGKLPSCRTTPSRAFVHSGVDYAGPIAVKPTRGRARSTLNCYICLFVCLVTKAIHLETVTSLTSAGFIAAYKRFISRRGRCSDIYSDCGTNFIGANKQLIELHTLAKKEFEDAADILAKVGTTWHFIPPGSPHFGGLWEAGVKSVKTHLYKTTGNASLTYEELETLLTQIEACLNSRPLCPISSQLDDFNVLTPGHFLIGEPLITIPEPSLLSIPLNRLSRWQYSQRLLQEFWKIWSGEYLTRLQSRPKWVHQSPNITVGQLVLVKDERLPPTKWALGRVTAIHPGLDNLVRAVSLKMNGVYTKRPITKLCVLPLPTASNEDII